ncbi:Lin1244/Lin1753 domain-containing protein [Aliarcobacter butzleri]|uniref:Lin1244/Lin1753 domain-containing protein n=1 Tax=Aliarcobacter butzleri TaxID=28197 RepID=UPI001869BBE1|nr:Lin1244/Lin1753 domain-containing protein [Aliarcobacter butzleri]
MAKTPPNFLFPTNFRNGKNIKRLIKDLNVQGYGIAVYLLETLAETEGHQYPISDIDLLADEMNVSVPVINIVINAYGLFEVIEFEDGSQFISVQLNKWLEPYYKQVEQRSLAGKVSSEKRRIKQEQQLLELSQLNSIQQPLNDSSTINKRINKRINKSSIYSSDEDEAEKLKQFNNQLFHKQKAKDLEIEKLENLAQANVHTQVIEIEI